MLWPATDEICFDSIKNDLPALINAIELCQRKRTVIQAGGNAGMYPLELAKYFKKVITFEPEPLNYFCLVENIGGTGIEAHNAALGNSTEPVSVSGWEPNCGSYEVSGVGDIPQMRIDDLKLKDVDLIYLDIQGSEGPAIAGAIETINRCKPIVVLEEGYGPYVDMADLSYHPLNKSTKKRVVDVIYMPEF